MSLGMLFHLPPATFAKLARTLNHQPTSSLAETPLQTFGERALLMILSLAPIGATRVLSTIAPLGLTRATSRGGAVAA